MSTPFIPQALPDGVTIVGEDMMLGDCGLLWSPNSTTQAARDYIWEKTGGNKATPILATDIHGNLVTIQGCRWLNLCRSDGPITTLVIGELVKKGDAVC